MSELDDVMLAPAPRDAGSEGTLLAGIADVVDRLADVVEGLGSSDPAAETTVSFLRHWAKDAREHTTPGPSTGRAPLDSLVARWGLSCAELDLVLLAGLAEEHEGLAGTLRALHPLGEPRPTVGLGSLLVAQRGVDRREVRRLLAEGPAAGRGVLRVEGNGGYPEQALVLAPGLWDVLHGVDATPPELARVELGQPLPGLDAWLGEEATRRAADAVRKDQGVTIVLSAEEQVVGGARCAALLASVGARPLAVRHGVEGETRLRDQLRLLAVHAAARAAVPVVMADLQDSAALDLEAITDVPGPVVVVAPPGRVLPRGLRPLLTVPVGPVTPESGRRAWWALLPGVDEESAAAIAMRTPADPAWIAGVARDLVVGGQPLTPGAVAAALRRRCGTALPAGVTLVSPEVGWEHLVLPAEAGLQLREAVTRLEHQGTVLDDWDLARTAHAVRGVRMLLTGPPGTGKSLAAEVLASAAQTDLLRVDLSQMVSKWLGETERNLGSTFAAAERTRAVLLFDEADALFGSRTEISDAHDRYANLETAYLLQRLDTFEGLAVLTTNLRHNIDPAFLRRMDFVVDFPTPDEDGRRDLWAMHLPAAHLHPDVDAATLARMYPIAGGSIRNAAVAAAFVAAAAGEDVHLHHLTAAVRREYGKASLPYPGEPPRRSR